MKPSEATKSAGLKDLAELSEISGQSPQTLNNWFNSEKKRYVFDAVLHYAVFHKNMGDK